MNKRYVKWGYESYKDNTTGETREDFIDRLNEQNEQIETLDRALDIACEKIEFSALMLGQVLDSKKLKKDLIKDVEKLKMNELLLGDIKSGQIFKSKLDGRRIKIINVEPKNNTFYITIENIDRKDRERKFSETTIKHFRTLLYDKE